MVSMPPQMMAPMPPPMMYTPQPHPMMHPQHHPLHPHHQQPPMMMHHNPHPLQMMPPPTQHQIINQNGIHSAKLGVSRFVYVGNLSWDVMWQDLKDHMKEAGTVIRADVMMGEDGRSKGCGIVEYSSVDEANNAILRLHNSNLKGRLIFVREDRDKDVENPNRQFGFKLFVGTLINTKNFLIIMIFIL